MLKLKTSNSLPLNSRFVIAFIVFVILNGVGLHFESIFKENSLKHIKGVGTLEELKTSIYKQRHLLSYVQMQFVNKGFSLNEGTYNLIDENNKIMKELVGEVQSLNSKSVFGIPSLREIYFDGAWRVDEGFTHFAKLVDSYLNIVRNLDRSKIAVKDNLYFEIEKHGENLINSLVPIQQELLKTRSQYYQYIKINDYIFRTSFFLMALAVFTYLYRPWRDQVDHFTKESARLREVLSESELKGNIYTWELNYLTKEIKHSKHLGAIFNLVDNSEYAYLYDELSLFDSKGREAFLEAIENCIGKDEDLAITVHVTTKNKKSYWLEYAAKKKHDGDDVMIVGTVQDVTAVKVAEQRFQDLFEELESPVVIFGDGQVRELNDAAKKFFGMDNDESYKLLHPAVMFPLYQEDGRSSLEKLSYSLEKLEGQSVINDIWSFHTLPYGTISAKTKLFDVTYNDNILHLMVISDNREAHDLEQRLVDAHRKAQFAKRSKIEFVANNGILLQGILESIEKVRDRLNGKEDYSEDEHIIDSKIIEKLKDRVQRNWLDNLHLPAEEGYGLIIFDLKEVITSLEQRWRKMTDLNTELSINIHFDKSYFWGDILKIKALLVGVVENAIEKTNQGEIILDIYHDLTNYNKELIKFSIRSTSEEWPGSDWIKLDFENSPVFAQEKINPRKVFNLLEYLDGDFELHKSANNLIHDGKINFTCTVKSVHGKMFKGENEVYFMMNREEYFVPYNETAISSTEIWTHFGGDWDLIESSIRDFINYYPEVISDIQIALEQKDGDLIYNSASELYGVLAHFPFFSSIDRVVLIQKYGEYLKFNEVEEELKILIRELRDFSSVLEEFLPNDKESAA